MKLNIKTPLIIALCCLSSLSAFAQKNLEKQISDSLTAIANSYAAIGRVSVANFIVSQKEEKILVVANDLLSQIPFRPENTKRIYDMLTKLTSAKYPGYNIVCQSDKRNIEDYIPNYYRKENIEKQRLFKTAATRYPLVRNTSRPYSAPNGLQSRNIALWHSHGLYYNQKLTRWTWQRARLFQTVEDLYTQSYVLPFLVPMLENAGANVLLPRERDTQLHEMIIDNDSKFSEHRYHEHSDRKSWMAGGSGFANARKTYLQGENPFQMGSYRYIYVVNDTDEMSYAEWTPLVPEDGYYAVYVSYKSVAASAPDARYTVYYKGGKTDFVVNQTMGGGTWLYLGRFKFGKGKSNQCKVVLSNYSAFADKVITADAVKIGGGMGNIARNPNLEGILPNTKSSDTTDVSKKIVKPEVVIEPAVSGYPRYTEAARYWLQWAGMPDSIYSKNAGKNDYTDDFQSRGSWVNYLGGGSVINPQNEGLKIPIDMAFAFHTDAGTTKNDSIIGTLGICTVANSAGKFVFESGYSRWTSRDLTDIIQTQIVDDVRKTFDPRWTRRGLWNKSYSEARVPEVPTMLLELLSHQNFADMRYGLDPQFRFTVSRAIYKGMLKYLCFNYGIPYVVQPLPVKQFSSRFVEKNKVELKWSAVVDSLEPTSEAESYLVYTQVDDGGFNNGVVTKNNRIVMEVQPGKVYRFKVAALNKGGESFPSEILSVYRANNDRPEVMIVNGFDRISAPKSFVENHVMAGFRTDDDPGVPYITDVSFVGKQYEYQRRKRRVSD